MYKYADSQEWCDEDYSQYVKIERDDDDEHGVPFPDVDLKILWDNKADETTEMLLIMCCSRWRISEYVSLEINMEKKYFMSGIKTEAGKGRIVPIHSGILPLVEHWVGKYGKLLPCSDEDFGNQMDELLSQLGIPGGPKHTPHDCRYPDLKNIQTSF